MAAIAAPLIGGLVTAGVSAMSARSQKKQFNQQREAQQKAVQQQNLANQQREQKISMQEAQAKKLESDRKRAQLAGRSGSVGRSSLFFQNDFTGVNNNLRNTLG